MRIFTIHSLLSALLFLQTLAAQVPAGYYNDANGLSGETLKTALHNIIKGHTVVDYNDIWAHFQNTDAKPNGKVWDIYSDIPGGTPPYEYTFFADQCPDATYSAEGDCYNREHSWPRSWVGGDISPMFSDIFTIYPVDAWVNGLRYNFPYGEVNSPTSTTLNGSKLGPGISPGYTGTVFEPIDEYKGDLARTFFYMATRYEDLIADWPSNSPEAAAILDGSSFPAFKSWYIDLLLSWHEQDPVSQKEKDRNNAVYAIQGNRNPFIDRPEYARYIWGTGQQTITYFTGFEASESFTASTIYNNTTIRYDGPAGQQWGTYYGTASTTAPISGEQSMQMRWYTTAPDNLGYTFTNFDLARPTRIDFYAAGTNGINVTASYSTDGGLNYTGNQTFELSSSPGQYSFVISETAEYEAIRVKFQVALPAPLPTATSRLYIDDVLVFGLPAEEPLIIAGPTELSGFIYAEGEGPSASQIITLSGLSLEPAEGNIAISGSANFEVSTDDDTFFASVLLPYTGSNLAATQVFVRLKAGLDQGEYPEETISITGGGTQTSVEVSGEVSPPSPPGYLVNFEGEGEIKAAYASGTINLSGLNWNMTDVMTSTLVDSDWYAGTRSARLRGYGTSSMTMLQDKPNGIGTISFQYRRYGTDTQVDWKVEYSLDQGSSWIQVGDAFTAPASDVVQTFSETVNTTGNVRVRIKRATETGSVNRRLNIDDIFVSDYEDGLPTVAAPTFDPPSGTYYSPLQVVISTSTPNAVVYYSLEGNTGAWTLYSESIRVRETATIWAYAAKEDMENSPVVSATYFLPQPAYTTLPYIETFDDGLGDCFVFSVSGHTKTWIWNSNGWAQMNGFDSGDVEEDWLILPGINFDNYQLEIMTFDTWKRFGQDDDDNYLKLLYSSDYAGTGDPTAATWTELAFNQPAAEQAWTASGSIDLSLISGEDVRVAFKYRYEPGKYRLWQIDNIYIFEAVSPALSAEPESLAGFGYVEGEGPSAAQSFEISGINLDLTDVVVTAPDNFEVSENETGPFGTALTLTAFDGAGTNIWIRLAAGLDVGDYAGSANITGGGAEPVNVAVSGAVTPADLPGYFVNFEGPSETKTTYATGVVTLSGLEWEMTQALIGTLEADKKNGLRSARIRRSGNVPGQMVMLQDKPNGIENISFLYARYGTETDQPVLTIQYSTDQGASWVNIGQLSSFPASLTEYTAVVNVEGNVRLRFITDLSGTDQRRFNIDDILVSDYAGGLTPVATPVFNPPGGNYIVPQQVEITTPTAGAAVYYTINGEEPDEQSLLYSAPIQIDATSTLKARAYAEGYAPSALATAQYNFPVNIATIAELRAAPADGTVYRLTGEAVLTFQHAQRNSKYIQDNTGAIKIDDPMGVMTTQYETGDGIVNIVGTRGEFANMQQFVPIADPGPANSQNNVVEPMVLSLAEINPEHQAMLVKVNEVVFDDDGLFTFNVNYNISDASGPGVFRTPNTPADLEYYNTPIPAEPKNITAVVEQYNETLQITARSLADFEEVTSGITLNIRVILEGPYRPTEGIMGADINAVLPLSQPFAPPLPYFGNSNPVWYYQGTESVEAMPDNVVDWVLIELRDAPTPQQATPSTVVAKKAALLLSDGQITGIDGQLPVFDLEIVHGMFAVVYHRNHLGVMSAQALAEVGGIYAWDFSTTSAKAYSKTEKNAFQQGHKHLGNGVYGMYGGDGDGNGQVQTQDKNNVWNLQSGLSGYLPSDFDLNGQVQTQDKNNIWNPNSGIGSSVPTNKAKLKEK